MEKGTILIVNCYCETAINKFIIVQTVNLKSDA